MPRKSRRASVSRREFLTRTSALGVSAVAAYGLLGLAAPKPRRRTPTPGGTLRMDQETKAMKDPRLADWSQISNFYRGWLEYLVEYKADGTFRGMLLESWTHERQRDRIHAERPQGREVDQRRRFHRR